MFHDRKTILSVFSRDSLSNDAYHEYSEQFLDQGIKQQLLFEIDDDRRMQLRAKFLSDDGKDPFSPSAETLKASGATQVNSARVKKCFERAYQIYRNVMDQQELEPARLYKLGWATIEMAETLRTLRKTWGNLQKLSNEQELRAFMKSMSVDEPTIHAALLDAEDEILKVIVGNPNFKDRRVALGAIGAIYEKVRDNIKTQLGYQFFKSTRDYKGLQQCYAVYDPKDDGQGNVTHSWGTNLTWTLAHIRRGNRFIVCSDILSNQYRSGYPDTPCAFAREVCVALKAGYTLCKTGDGVTMEPKGLSMEHLQDADSTGLFGDNVNPSHDEVSVIYRQLAQAHWNEHKNFECRFEFDNGGVRMLVNKPSYQETQLNVDDLTSRLSVAAGDLLSFSRNIVQESGKSTIAAEFDAEYSNQESLQQSENATDVTKKMEDVVVGVKPLKPK